MTNDIGNASEEQQRAMEFGFGAPTVARAVKCIRDAPIASESFREFLLDRVTTDATVTMVAPKYALLVEMLNDRFSATNIDATAKAFRQKFGSKLDGYVFSGFVADEKEDASNGWIDKPSEFRADAKSFAPEDVREFERKIKENLSEGNTPSPIHFQIWIAPTPDKLSHMHINPSETDPKKWECAVVCHYDP
ncbi:hypothetical protein [Reyranella sp.]|uniref:hypothetical protein n=1 Tax=Reyranella sp. TaxID=1929291 RepID=UPI003784C47F